MLNLRSTDAETGHGHYTTWTRRERDAVFKKIRIRTWRGHMYYFNIYLSLINMSFTVFILKFYKLNNMNK